MKEFSIVVLIFIATQTNAQCIGFDDISYDSLNDYEIFQPKDSLFIANAIRMKCDYIDKQYDSLLYLKYTEKRFCEKSKFCFEIDTAHIQAFVNKGRVSKLLIIADTKEGKLITQYYFWEDKIYAHQTYEYFLGEAPKSQWISASGVPGWEVVVLVCDSRVYSYSTIGIKDNPRKRNSLGESPTFKILFDLVDVSFLRIAKYVKIMKNVKLDYSHPMEN